MTNIASFAANGTISLDGSGAQDFNSGGLTRSLYNLTHNGTGTTTLQSDIKLLNNFRVSNGTVNDNDHSINIIGDWDTRGGTFESTNGSVTFEDKSRASNIFGNNIFNNFWCTAEGKAFTIEAGSRQKFVGVIKIAGQVGKLITIYSSIPFQTWEIDPSPNILDRQITFVKVQDSRNILEGITNEIYARFSLDGGRNINWRFGATLWTNNFGAGDNLWSTGSNWIPAGVPEPEEDVQFAFDGPEDSIVDPLFPGELRSILIDPLYMNTITFQTNVKVRGAIEMNGGNVILGTSAVSADSFVQTGGTFEGRSGIFTGESSFVVSGGNFSAESATIFAKKIITLNAAAFNSDTSTIVLAPNPTMEFDASGVTLYNLSQTLSGTVELLSDLILNGSFIRTSGNGLFNRGDHLMTMAGNFINTSGTFETGNFNKNITIGGNVDLTGGTFNQSNSTLVFNGNSVVTSDVTMLNNVTLKSGKTLALRNIVDINGVLSLEAGTLDLNDGLLRYSGNTLNTTNLTSLISTNNSTFEFDKTSGTQTIVSGGITKSFGTILHSGASTLEIATNDIRIGNSFINPNGDFKTNNLTMKIGGDWNNTATFLQGTGTVEFEDATKPSVVSGATTFHNFVSNTPGKLITFEAGSLNTIEADFTLAGSAGNYITLRSSASPLQWRINTYGIRNIDFVDVKDSWNINVRPIYSTNTLHNGNNIGWVNEIGQTIYWH